MTAWRRLLDRGGGAGGSDVRLGLRANAAQFAALAVVNGFVGAMVGMERSILPALAEETFHLVARSAVLSFIVVFGVTKAVTNYLAGRLSDSIGRKPVLVAGWILAAPVPLLLIWAPSWRWVLVANALLGVSQGLAWSTTVIMKIDLVGAGRRGLAMGINEFAGYLAVAAAALATGWLASRSGLRPEPFYLGMGFVAIGLTLSLFVVRETAPHAARESALVWGDGPAAGVARDGGPARQVSQREVFWQTTVGDRTLSSATQAGLVNNLNDAMVWGLFPIVFVAAGLTLAQVGVLAAIYPATWGATQLATGALSDRVGRKPLIASGMWLQAAAIGVVATSGSYGRFAGGAFLLGLGTAMVYPTLLAAIGDVARPAWRATSMGVYRLWRDLGYALGALLTGFVADRIGVSGAMWTVAALTFVSGLVVAVRMREPQHGQGPRLPSEFLLERLRGRPAV